MASDINVNDIRNMRPNQLIHGHRHCATGFNLAIHRMYVHINWLIHICERNLVRFPWATKNDACTIAASEYVLMQHMCQQLDGCPRQGPLRGDGCPRLGPLRAARVTAVLDSGQCALRG